MREWMGARGGLWWLDKMKSSVRGRGGRKWQRYPAVLSVNTQRYRGLDWSSLGPWCERYYMCFVPESHGYGGHSGWTAFSCFPFKQLVELINEVLL